MNLKLKRTTRTPSSEEMLIFDTDSQDETGEAVNIGKTDIHYLDDQIVGTLLIWEEFAVGYNRLHAPGSEETMDDLIDLIMSEISDPVGVSSEYGIEVYFPSIQNYRFVGNYAGEGEEDLDSLEGPLYEPEYDESTAQDDDEDADDFSKQLRSRP